MQTLNIELTAAITLAVTSTVLLAVSVWKGRRRERQIEQLYTYLMRIQDSLELPNPAGCQEGSLGILESEIYKLVVYLKEQSRTDTKQKEYLAKMLSDISHQIKTPLTSITILTDLLKNAELSKEQQADFVEKIDTQISRVSWLVRNLLTLSQLEADVLKLKRETVNVRVLLEKACTPFEIIAEVRKIELVLHADTSIKMVCDMHWTAEALSNIIKNCIEHTPAGGSVTMRAQQNNFASVIQIADTGEGISKEDLAHIFDRFYKGSHTKADTKTDSIGIGLALSRQIIMQQNGIIHVESEPGQGSVFTIKFYI